MEKSSREDRLGNIALWPDLSFHYGLSVFELMHMPRNLRQLFVDELPRLLAERELMLAGAASYPHLKASDQRTYMRELRLEARNPRAERRQVRALSKAPDIAAGQLAGMGIGLHIVDKDGNEVTPDA